MIDDPLLPPVGVIPVGDGSACFRVWAPKAKKVEIFHGRDLHAQRIALKPEPRGFHAITVPMPEIDGRFPHRYAYIVDGGEPRPDPASRSQPEGVHKPSAVFFPDRFGWDEGGWQGIGRADLVIYELHVGTFTSQGTFDDVIPRLSELVELGIRAVEVMPIAQFPGDQSWGYDGVFPFAVQSSYGGPEGFQRLVAACHRVGLAVILDVVFNHFGPEGNVFPDFGPYLTEKYKTGWGPALNFDDAACDPVRALILDNVRMWVGEFRVDGLRLDAADQIFDRGASPILAEIAEVAHREAAKLGRPCHVFAETDLNDAPRFLRNPDRGGYGLDGHWTDDFHHALHATLTGEANGYYVDFADGPAALEKVLGCVVVNDGSYSPFRDRRHGTSALEFPGDRFVAFSQNHDQVGNRAESDRHAGTLSPAAVRLSTGILLLAPRLPLLFMGQEYGETKPFPFFSGFSDPELIEQVRKGRKEEFASFGWDREPPDPFDPATRASAVLSWDWSDPDRTRLRQLHRDLLRIRRESSILRDFRHPEVRRVGDGRLLLMSRRDESGRSLTAAFNLGPEIREIPSGSVEGPPSFRSEGGSRPGTLEPWEFAVFAPLD